jgi:hypothetical protein
MKDWHLCLGSNCAIIDDFEDLNCADPIETADKTADESLGPALPGCDLGEYCDDGMYEPCDCEGDDCDVVSEYSAEIHIDYTHVDPTDLIPQDHTETVPTYEVIVEEALLPYIT